MPPRIAISSGHGSKVRGASGYLDEVDEARRVVNEVALLLEAEGCTVYVFHDDISTSQNENLNRIVNFHNSKERDFDVSVHFNMYETTSKPMGSEVLYVSSTGLSLADPTVDAICRASGLVNRGPKKRTDLFFLNNTEEPAILIETCFVDSSSDASTYEDQFDDICEAIATTLAGTATAPIPEPEPEPAPPPITEAQREHIIGIANSSAIASYYWKGDRGVAPQGYTQGFALAWSTVVTKYLAGHPAVVDMAKANTHNDAIDAISWYNSNFRSLGMTNEVAGLDTLRHLFVLLMGLGMRESSGKHCEGRDMSAENVTADTAEAGLYQTSYNAHSSTSLFDLVMDEYERKLYPSYIDEFSEDVSCDANSWQSYGSGKGREFQDLCKNRPAFAVESCALVLRNLRQHYGPINRKEAELRLEADEMLLDVQNYLEGTVEPSLEERVSALEVKVLQLESDIAALDSRIATLEQET